MSAALNIPLGAPGVYYLPDTPIRQLSGVRMDVCAFVGVAPRGPVRVPVVDQTWTDDRPSVEPGRPLERTAAYAVESFDAYRLLYGGFEGPGLLPYAVASFFEQGGRRAYIARIVHEYGDPGKNAARVAAGTVAGATTSAGPLVLRARNEGSWGNGLTASLGFSRTPVSIDSASAKKTGFDLSAGFALPIGALLALTLPDGTVEYRFAAEILQTGRANAPGRISSVVFDQAASDAPVGVEMWEGVLSLDDGDGRTELHNGLGCSPDHPRWMATVLCWESDLVVPDVSWIAASVKPKPDAPGLAFAGGEDGYGDITPDDFFDPLWTPADDTPGVGVQSLALLEDLSIVVVPDLYSPEPLAPEENIVSPVSLAGPEFARCVDPPLGPTQQAAVPDLAGLRLDPRLPSDLARIEAYQAQLVAFAEQVRSFIVLLDVPPGLNQRQILRWRGPYNSYWAGCYHPWIMVSRRDDQRDALVRVPPSAIAAGIVARIENAFGVPYGPANALVAEAVDVADVVSPARHDELHPQGINVYLRERDGIRLTAARTLSRDPAWRQLSVRRLITMICRSLLQQMQWIVFEPNNAALRAEVRRLITVFLRRLFRLGAFKGASEEESFFVACDETLNPQRVLDAGQLIAEIGVAPSEPLEFIVVQLSRPGDGTLTLET